MPPSRRGEDAIDQDFALHCSIADATGNPQFRRFLEYLGRFIIPRQTIRGGPGIPKRAYSETFQKEHRDIVQAIRDGAVSPARAAMRRHLLNSRNRYQKLAAELGKTDSSVRVPDGSIMQKVLVTGAAGGIGSRLRKLLKGVYPEHPLERPRSARRPRRRTRPSSRPISAVMGEVERAVEGVQGIVHLGGFSVEGPWETILNANIIGCYNLFEAARRAGVERIVFASSNHAVGFYPRQRRIGVEAPVRPDSRYGASKAFGEALAALYAFKHGLRVTCLRIGNVADAPVDKRRLVDLAQARGPRAAHPHRARASRTSATRFSTASRTMRADGGTTARPFASATGRRAAPRITAPRRSPPTLKLPPDPVGEWYQGGPYCSDEFDGGIERAPT